MSMTCQILPTTRLTGHNLQMMPARAKNIDLAAAYQQRDLDKLPRWCAKWRIKLYPEKKNIIVIFSKSQTAIRAESALSLYSDLLLYYPQIKFLGITFDNRMTFTKHFEEIFRTLQPKISSFKNIGQQKWGQVPQPFCKSTNNV